MALRNFRLTISIQLMTHKKTVVCLSQCVVKYADTEWSCHGHRLSPNPEEGRPQKKRNAANLDICSSSVLSGSQALRGSVDRACGENVEDSVKVQRKAGSSQLGWLGKISQQKWNSSSGVERLCLKINRKILYFQFLPVLKAQASSASHWDEKHHAASVLQLWPRIECIPLGITSFQRLTEQGRRRTKSPAPPLPHRARKKP